MRDSVSAMPRFSANLHFLFTELPFLDRFGAAAAAGFRAVEFPDPYSHDVREIRARLDDHGLGCVLINMPMGDPARGDKGLACLTDRQTEFQEGVARAIDSAALLGCPRINCLAGRQPPGSDRRALRATLVENLGLAARQLAAANLALDLEPLNTVENPGYLVGTSSMAVEIMRDVAAPNLALQFDCYHLEIMEGGLLDRITKLAPQIGHIQIADVPGRHQPGSGRIDFPAVFAAIDRSGYQGWVGAEYIPVGPTGASFGWLPG
jgi:hydroxypyruvate isomerase